MVEASFDGVFHTDPDIAIVADPRRQVMWQKERLLNVGLAALPRTADKVAWIDADILFDNPDWADEAIELLEDWPVVQLFETVAMLNSSGGVASEHLGKVAARERGRRERRPLKTGFAWAARREAIGLDALRERPISSHVRRGGLFDLDIVGGGDSSMISAWLGRNTDWLVRHMNREFLTAYRPWAIDAHHRVRGRLGFVRGRIQHLYHGSRRQRRYGSRIAPLRACRYTPHEDIRLAENGLWEWASEKPAMHAAVKRYFETRNEDAA